MTTIKSYTDLQQSRRLAKVLAIETSDYYYPITYIEESTNKYLMCYIKPYIGRLSEIEDSVDTRLYIPCWSLAVLLGVLPKIHKLKPILDLEENSIQYSGIDLYVVADNPVDACVAMIEKLHELNLL